MNYKDIHIKMFPAKTGDCFFIEFTKADFRVLIDGGFVDTYKQYLKPYLLEIAKSGRHINLMIISHIDQDHINGIKALLEENGHATSPQIVKIDEVWFNGFRHTKLPRSKSKIPCYEKFVLEKMANKNSINDKAGGINEISFKQGNSVSELLINNGYNWNTSAGGGAICVDIMKSIVWNNITFKILNPTQNVLNDLAEDWLWTLQSMCKKVVVTDNRLFDDAFEGAFISEHDDWVAVKKEISAGNETHDYQWDFLADMDDDEEDNKLANQSSIAVLISYEDVILLFPGDCAIGAFHHMLPDKIDIVKLPHHGSGKNMDKNFIRKTEVSFYLLSTNGGHTGHPSQKIIANILTKAPGSPIIVKNYDVPLLDDIGILEGEQENGD